MYNWEKQFELISQGMAFVSRHGGKPFDIVVRMRMVCCCLYRGARGGVVRGIDQTSTAPRPPRARRLPLSLRKSSDHRMRNACHVSGRAPRCPSTAVAPRNPR